MPPERLLDRADRVRHLRGVGQIGRVGVDRDVATGERLLRGVERFGIAVEERRWRRPAALKRCAMPRPIPRAPPVTTATWPDNVFVADGDSQDVDGRGRVVHARDAAAGALREPDPGVAHLPLAGAALELPRDLDDLRDARRAERMALGEQSAAGIDRHAPAEARSHRCGCSEKPSPRGASPSAS